LRFEGSGFIGMQAFSEEEGVPDEVIVEVIVDNVSQLTGDMARGEGHAEGVCTRGGC
jgi:hypothetical protein